MLYRVATFGIVAFWLVMMVLLVRLETHPEASDIMDVPVSYVERIMFKHGQQSILSVRESEKPIGSVAIHPSISASGGRTLDFSGTLSLQLPLAERQRFNFGGTVEMDGATRVLGFHADLGVQQTHTHLSLKGDMVRKIFTCEATQGGQPAFSQTLPMDSSFGPSLIKDLGIDPAALPVAAPGGITPPTVTARETQITLRGEKLEVYQVSLREGTLLAADFYVTELGQVVLATTNFGYSLAGEDYE